MSNILLFYLCATVSQSQVLFFTLTTLFAKTMPTSNRLILNGYILNLSYDFVVRTIL